MKECGKALCSELASYLRDKTELIERMNTIYSIIDGFPRDHDDDFGDLTKRFGRIEAADLCVKLNEKYIGKKWCTVLDKIKKPNEM